MGQPPLENEYGTCPTCDWDPWSPAYLTCIIDGVLPPTIGGPWPSINGIHTLKATGLCTWRRLAPCYKIVYHLGLVTGFIAHVYIDCNPITQMLYFNAPLVGGCVWEFDNNVPPPPEINYHDGTVFVNLNLTVPAGEAVPDWGLLPDEGWKYEHMQAANDLEQYYIGSRKYKTNCRILFDPEEVEP